MEDEIKQLLGVSAEEEKEKRAARCDNPSLPGMVRVSFGCYTNEEDINIFLEALEKIARRQYRGTYTVDPIIGMYRVKGYTVDASKHFRFFNPAGDAVASEEVA